MTSTLSNRFMRGLRLTIVGFLAVGGILWSQTTPSYIEQKKRLSRLHIEQLMSEWLQVTGVPGAVIVLVEEGQTLVLDGFGLANASQGTPVEPSDTVFMVGELARAMTTIAVLQLVERGRVDLQEDISGPLSVPTLTARLAPPITVESLLLHTAGFDERITATRARAPDQVITLRTYLERRMPPRVRPRDLVSVPSSHGYSLAGLLVEVLSQESFPRYLARHLFEPLGMVSSTVDVGAGHQRGLATGYRLRDGRRAGLSLDFPQTSPASFLLTTAADMDRWLRAVLAGGALDGKRILEPKSVQRLLSRQFSNHELLAGRTLAFREGVRYSPAELFLGASGSGFSSAVVMLPDLRLGLFVACNGEVPVWDLVYRILDRFAIRRVDPKDSTRNMTLDQVPLLAGYWRDTSVSLSSAEKLLSLALQDRIRQTGDQTLVWQSREYVATGPLVFQQLDGPLRLCFIKDEGRIRFAATGSEVIEKLAWYEIRPVQGCLWVAFAALFLAAGWPGPPLPRRQQALNPTDLFSPRWPVSLARFAATLHFVFIVTLAALLARISTRGAESLLYGVPTLLLVAQCLPLVAAALTLIAALGAVSAWRSSDWTNRHRLRLVLLLVALIAYLPFLHDWNLLGFYL